jgi:transposase-like protein
MIGLIRVTRRGPQYHLGGRRAQDTDFGLAMRFVLQCRIAIYINYSLSITRNANVHKLAYIQNSLNFSYDSVGWHASLARKGGSTSFAVLFLSIRFLGDFDMRKSRFSTRQMASALEEAASGTAVKDVCAKHGISVPTFYLWKKKHKKTASPNTHSVAVKPDLHPPAAKENTTIGQDKGVAQLQKRLSELEKENDLLRRLFIETSLERASWNLNGKAKRDYEIAESLARKEA